MENIICKNCVYCSRILYQWGDKGSVVVCKAYPSGLVHIGEFHVGSIHFYFFDIPLKCSGYNKKWWKF